MESDIILFKQVLVSSMATLETSLLEMLTCLNEKVTSLVSSLTF